MKGEKMKCNIVNEEIDFKPIELRIVIESKEELQALYHRFNESEHTTYNQVLKNSKLNPSAVLIPRQEAFHPEPILSILFDLAYPSS